jgi:aryl-alcohol dehydrogenase-like predicted oxidoreductase
VSRLAIGTVQFGLPYGVSNTNGQVPLEEARSIVARAKAAGIDTLDTAVNYGESEARLGEIGVTGWRVISKLPGLPADRSDIARWADDLVAGSLQRLGVDHLHGLLLHRPAELLGSHGAELYASLMRLRDSGLVRRIGASIYDPKELDLLVPRFALDIVQGPFNIVDRRIIESGWLSRLADLGTEFHARSVFLQGLLLMKSGDRPKRFDEWESLWSSLDLWRRETGVTPIESCLRFVLASPAVARAVVGVQSRAELEQILAAAGGSALTAPGWLASSDVRLINPSQWTA